jgi:RDD family/FHA domain
VSDAEGYVCSQCGTVSATWTVFCERCGAPRAARAPVSTLLAGAGVGADPVAAFPPMAPGTFAAPGVAVPTRAFATLGLSADFAGMQPARAARRIAAFSIDAAFAAIIGVAAFLIWGPAFGLLAAAEVVVGQLVWEGNTGRTLGNVFLNLRTTRTDAPRTLGSARAALRGLIVLVGFLVAGVGSWIVVLSSAWDSSGRRQAFSDRVGGSVTIGVPGGRRTTTTEWRVRKQPVAETVEAPPRGAVPSAAPAPAEVEAPSAPSVPSSAPLFVSLSPSAAPPRELTAEQEERAEAIRLISPTVVSTRITVRDVDERSGDPIEDSIAPMPGADVAASVPALGSILIAFDTGLKATVPVPGAGVIGRAPRGLAASDHLITVDDPDKSISRSHVRFELDADTVRVLDTGSTNGTDLLDDEGGVTRLQSDTWTEVPSGARVRMGERVFTLTPVEPTRTVPTPNGRS